MKNILSKIVILLLVPFISLYSQKNEEIIINEDLKIIYVSDNIYKHVSNLKLENGYKYPCNGLIFLNENKCVVVDTPPYNNLSEDLIDWIIRIKQVEIIGIIATHWHNDCAGGLDAFHKNNIASYGLEFTRDTLIQQNLAYPENVFSDSSFVNVGNKSVELFYPGPGHAKDNIVVWFNDEKLLFGGCLVKELNSTSLGYIVDADIGQWDKSLLFVKNKYRDAQIIIPGHGSEGGLELIDSSINLVKKHRNK